MDREMLNELKTICKHIKQNWKNYYWWKEQIPARTLGLYYAKIKGNKGVYVMEEDWDNLIILDACRYDYFKEVTGINADYRISRGSNTMEFLEENFSADKPRSALHASKPSVKRKFKDTVVVTANPWLDMWLRDSFYQVISLWKSDWDVRRNTVHPQTVVESAIAAERKYPNKRLITWFMQPHSPFILYPEIDLHGARVNAAFRRYGTRTIREAYRSNLGIVIPYAFELAQNLRGKTVITADHGEGLKSRLLWFPFPHRLGWHYAKVYIPELVKVPWLVFGGKERKEIRKGTKEERIRDKIAKLKASGKV